MSRAAFRPGPAGPALMLLALLAAGAARGDDWAQFRRDPYRSGASTDRVPAPLVELWSRRTGAHSGGPLHTVAVWKGRVFFVDEEVRKPYVFCADARSGRILWRRPLETRAALAAAFDGGGGLAVTENGLVYVYDTGTVLRPLEHAEVPPSRTSGRFPAGGHVRISLPGRSGGIRTAYPGIRAFRAADGAEVGSYLFQPDYELVSGPWTHTVPSSRARDELARRQAGSGHDRGVAVDPHSAVHPTPQAVRLMAPPGTGRRGSLEITGLPVAPEMRVVQRHPPRLFLLDGYPNQLLLPQQPMDGALGMRLRAGDGPRTRGLPSSTPLTPLVVGNELAALSWEDYLYRWMPGQTHWVVRLARAYPRFPAPQLVPGAHFAGYPLTLCPSGMVLADDSSARHGLGRFLAVMDAGHHVLWYRQSPWTLGISAVQNALIFTGVGGADATRGILAVDASAGQVRWAFAPGGLSPDPAGLRLETPPAWPLLQLPSTPPPVLRPSPVISLDPPLVSPGGSKTKVEKRPPVKRAPVTQQPAPVVSSRSALIVAGGTLNGHLLNPGLVASGGRLYGVAGGYIAALQQETGAPLWARRLPLLARVRSLAGSRDTLFLSYTLPSAEGPAVHGLAGLRAADGRLEWLAQVPAPGVLAVARGLLFFADGRTLRAYAPAERVFRMAIDSPRRADYREEFPLPQSPDAAAGSEAGQPEAAGDTGAGGAGAEAPCAPASAGPEPVPAPPGSPAAAAEPAPRRPDGLADATMLRLAWGEPLPELLRKTRERQAAAATVPMLLSLDWLDRYRARVRGTASPEGWTAKETEAFAAACARLAEAAQPAAFDVAPEVNVYLARYPERLPGVLALVRQARAAIQKASPRTEVLVSLNHEVLRGRYGLGTELPFGKLTNPTRKEIAPLEALLEAVDRVGLTSHPAAALKNPAALGADYFLDAREALGKRPLLVTRLAAPYDAESGGWFQTEWVGRLLQAVYWLEAGLVAYPDLAREAPGKEEKAGAPPGGPDLALRVGETERPGLEPWWAALHWRRVEGLTAEEADPARTP